MADSNAVNFNNPIVGPITTAPNSGVWQEWKPGVATAVNSGPRQKRASTPVGKASGKAAKGKDSKAGVEWEQVKGGWVQKEPATDSGKCANKGAPVTPTENNGAGKASAVESNSAVGKGAEPATPPDSCALISFTNFAGACVTKTVPSSAAGKSSSAT